MKVILKADVDTLGEMGAVVSVKEGYARNFLIPRGLAVPATTRNVKQLEHTKKVIEDQRRQEKNTSLELAKKLEQAQVRITAKVGEEQRLYGSVTTAMIADSLNAQGFAVDKRKIQLVDPIRATGVFTVPIKLPQDVTAEVKVWVVGEDEVVI